MEQIETKLPPAKIQKLSTTMIFSNRPSNKNFLPSDFCHSSHEGKNNSSLEDPLRSNYASEDWLGEILLHGLFEVPLSRKNFLAKLFNNLLI